MMNWKFLKYWSSFFLLVVLLSSCFQSEYTKLVKSELAKGIRKDSILLGINLGSTRNDFFGRCYDLNQQHLVIQGPTGSSVQYTFMDSTVHAKATSLRLLLFPSFDNKEVMTDMNLEFSYSGWAPWNRSLQSDSLKTKVIRLLTNWYGGNEFVTAHVKDTDVPVKVDGNRRVLVYVKDTQTIVVKVQDILHPKFDHFKKAEKN